MDYLVGYDHLKTWLADGAGVDKTTLHIHAGLAIYLLAASLLFVRRSLWWSLGLVVLLEAANEMLDGLRYWQEGWPWTPWGTVSDIVHTVFWPLVLTLIAQRAGLTFGTRPARQRIDIVGRS